MKKACKRVAAAAGAVALSAGSSFAAVDLTGVTLDTATPTTLAGTIVGGLAVMWGIRKVIKTINRS